MGEIQVPQIKRDNPQGPESIGRVQLQVDNGASEFGQTANKLVSAVSGIKDSYDKALEQGATLTATDVSNQYEARRKAGLAQIKSIEGDATQAFTEYDKQSQQWQKDFLDKYKDAPDITRQMIAEKMSAVHARTADDRLVQETIQREAFDKATTKAAVDNRKQSLLTSTANFNPKDAQTVNLFDANVDAIREPLLERGARTGLATKNPDGTWKDISPILNDQVRQSVSEGLKSAIQNLNDNGKPEEAQFLLEKYKDQMVEKDQHAVMTGNKESMENQKALEGLQTVRKLGLIGNQDAAFAWIDKNEPNLQIAEKIRQKFVTFVKQQDEGAKSMQNNAFNKLTKYIDGAQQQGRKFVTEDDFTNDPMVKNLLSKVSLDQKNKVIKSVFKPAFSDPKQLSEITQARIDGSFYQQTPDQFEQMVSGLAEKDQRKNRELYAKRNDPTNSQQRETFNYMHQKMLVPALFDNDMIKPNAFGHYEGDDLKLINHYSDLLDDAISVNKINNIDDQKKIVTDLITNGEKGFMDRIKQGKPAQPVATPSPFNGTATPPPAPPKEKDVAAAAGTLTADEWKEARAMWKEEYHRPFNNQNVSDTSPALAKLWLTKKKQEKAK